MFANPEKNISQFHIDPGMTVAEFGSGAGHYSIAAAKLVGESGKVYAIDVQQNLLQKLKNDSVAQGLNNINIIWGDLDEFKGSELADRIIDRVIVANTLFQIENKEEFIKEVYRVLKPNGQVLIIDWTDSFGGLGPTSDNVIAKDVAHVLFESNRFSFVKEIMPGDHHYGLIFKKI